MTSSLETAGSGLVIQSASTFCAISSNLDSARSIDSQPYKGRDSAKTEIACAQNLDRDAIEVIASDDTTAWTVFANGVADYHDMLDTANTNDEQRRYVP